MRVRKATWRKTLGGSTFLRLYVLLAMALLLFFALTLLGATLVDKVRRGSYREQLADAPMTLVAEQLARLPDEFQQPWLDYQANRLAIDMAIRPLSEPSLGYLARSRLEAGKTRVSESESGGWLLQRRLPGTAFRLDARIRSIDQEQMMALARLLSSSLVRVSASQRRARIQQLSNASLPLAISDQQPDGVASGPALGLITQETRINLDPQHWAVTLHLRLSRGTEQPLWLVVGPLQPFEPLPDTLLLLLLMLLLGLLAVLIFLAVRSTEGRVNRLEIAATHIASGRLDTRVAVEGNDFLARLGLAINGMASRVQSLLQTQQEMMRAVSHELRTPLARLRFAAQMIKDDTTTSPQLQRQLGDMDDDIDELDGLVDEILTYAQLGSEADRETDALMQHLDCVALARQVIDSLAPLNTQRQLRLEADRPVEVVGERRYLQRALQNLVANACRHATHEVRICVFSTPGQVRIDVEDDGPGVPRDARRRIFTPFARLDDSRTRRSGGYGLGLSIVQRVMRWHGGSVMVSTSQRLGGACFSLLLPQVDVRAGRE